MHVGMASLRLWGKRSRHSRRMRNITYLERGPCIDTAHVAHINPSRVDFVKGNILRIQILSLMDIEMSQLFEIRNVTDLPASHHHSSDLNYLWVKMTR